MKLLYRFKHKLLGNSIRVKEPIIPAILIGANRQQFPVTAVLDTGSDFVLLPLELAEALELKFDLAKTDPATTYSGEELATTRSRVRIRIERQREHFEFECKCAVLMNKKKQHSDIIFGSSFLEEFKAVFDYPNNKFGLIH